MPNITLIAHNIRSAHNVGSIFRSAEGFGVTHIVLSGYTPYPKLSDDPRLPHIAEKVHAQIHKTALGAETMVPFSQYDNLLTWFNASTLPLVALEQTDTSVVLRDFIPPDAFALLLGEEVSGIEDELLRLCSAAVEIPMVGQKESFNVSVACGIALYELLTT